MICPKCSSDKGWDGPKFVVHSSNTWIGWSEEYLQYRCKTCGYDRLERCHDHDAMAAKKAEQEAQIRTRPDPQRNPPPHHVGRLHEIKMLTRRFFLKAPAVVAAASLMPIRSVDHILWPHPHWCPEGWLPCDGRPIPLKYTELLANGPFHPTPGLTPNWRNHTFSTYFKTPDNPWTRALGTDFAILADPKLGPPGLIKPQTLSHPIPTTGTIQTYTQIEGPTNYPPTP